MATRQRGPRRHINPDGSEGGLVDANSFVSPTAYIGRHVEIKRNSRIEDDAKVLDRAQIINATIQGNAVVKDYATVFDCTVKDNAEIGGRSSLSKGISGSLEVSGQTRIHNVDIHIPDNRHMKISGGKFELPEEAFRPMFGSPTLMARGDYDSETGSVAIKSVRAGSGGMSPQPTHTFQDEGSLCQFIELTLPKGLPTIITEQIIKPEAKVIRSGRADSQAKDR